MAYLMESLLVELLHLLVAPFELGQLLAFFVAAHHVVILYHIARDATVALC